MHHVLPRVVRARLGCFLTSRVQLWRFPCASLLGVKRLESSWHGRPTLEKEREKNSAPPHRRAQKVMVRSSSDSSYMSGSPGGSPCSGSVEKQPSDRESSTHSPSLPLGREPGVLPMASSRLLQESPPLPESLDGHPPLRLKKSFEILVRKPTSSKPKPPPRKYFKSDSEPQQNPEERENSLCPSGHSLPSCSQVRGHVDGLSVLCLVPHTGIPEHQQKQQPWHNMISCSSSEKLRLRSHMKSHCAKIGLRLGRPKLEALVLQTGS